MTGDGSDMRQRGLWIFVVVAAAYASGSQFAYSWFGANDLGASFFPAAGVTMAALILVERRLWPIVLLAAGAAEFTVDVLQGTPPAAAAGYAVANLAQPLLGATLVTRMRPRLDLARIDDLLVFLAFAVVVAPALGGVLGASTFTLFDGGDAWARFAAEWWVGDGLGVLVVGSAVIAARSGVRRATPPPRLLEAAAIAGACAAASFALFWWEWLAAALVLFMFMIVAGFRLDTWAVALTGALVAFIAGQAIAGERAFWRALDLSPSEGVLYLQIMLGAILVSALGVAAEIRGRERAAQEVGAVRRLQQIADAAPAMLWVTDADNRCTFLSRGWYDYTGLDLGLDKDAAWVGAIHPDDRSSVWDGLADAAARRDDFALDFRIRRADGLYRRAIDAGRPRRDADGRFLGYVGTVLDVDERLRVEEALRQSEAQLRTLFASIDEGYCLCELILDDAGRPRDYRFLEVNDIFETMTGLAGARGRTARELVPDLELKWVEIYSSVALEGTAVRFEQGSEAMGRIFDVFATPVEPRGRFALVFTDVTGRRRAEAARELAAVRDRFRGDLTDRLRELADPVAAYAAAAEGLAGQLGATRAFFGEVDDELGHVVIRAAYPAGIAEASGGHHALEDLVGPHADLVRAGRPVVVADADEEGGRPPSGGVGLEDARAYIAVGLMRAGHPVALLGVQQDAPRRWTEEEVALVEAIAQRTWLAAQRARSEQALRESEARFRSLADAVPDLIWLTDPDGLNEFVNVAYQVFVGAPADRLTGMAWRQFVHPDDVGGYVSALRSAVRHRQHFGREVRMRRADGEYRWVRTVAEPRQVDDRYAGYVGSTIDVHDAHLERERDALLAYISVELDRELGPRERIDRLPRVIVGEGFADKCLVLLLGPARAPELRARAARTPDDEALIDRLVEAAPVTREAIARISPRVVADAGEGFLKWAFRGEDDRALLRELDVRTVMWAPLVARGRQVGALWVARGRGAPAYTDRDFSIFLEIARRAAIALDNAVLYDAEVDARHETERARTRLDQLYRMTAALSAAASAADVGEIAAAGIAAATGADGGRLVVRASGDGALTTLATTGRMTEPSPDPATMHLHAATPLAECARTGRPVFLGSRDEVRRRYPDFARAHEQIAAAAFVPVDAGALGLCFPKARDFADSERDHLEAMGRLTGQALQRAQRFEYEREWSSQLQRSLLPAGLPDLPGVSLARSYRPGMAGTEAGGDWFDAVELAGGRLAITVGDVVGRGLPAATVMGQLRSALNGFLISGSSPGVALAHLNRFASQVEGASCTSAMCVVLDTTSGVVTWARAGHPPLCHVTADGAALLTEVNGTVLGVIEGRDYPEFRFTMAPGEALLAYSDGLVERRGEDLLTGLERVRSVASSAPRPHAQRLLESVEEAALPPGGVDDDVVIVAVVRHLAASQLSVGAEPVNLAIIRRAVREWCAPLGLVPADQDDVIIALGEAIANAAEHAYPPAHPGSIRVDMTHADDGTLVIGIEDDGTWRSPRDDADRGRGLPLMRAVMDEVSVAPSPSGTRVELTFNPRRRDTGAAMGAAPPAAEPYSAETAGAGHDRLLVRGDVDEASAPLLAEALGDLMRAGEPRAVDVTHLSYLGSAGVRVLVQAGRRAARSGSTLRVIVQDGGVAHRVLETAGVPAELDLDILSG